MKEIKLFEQIINGEIEFKESGAQRDVVAAYSTAKRNGNQILDFNDCIWEENVEAITAELRKYDIREFTISNSYSGLIKVLKKFEDCGCKMFGIMTVNAPYTSFGSAEYEKLSAIKMVM